MPLGLYLYKTLTFMIAPFLGAFFRRRASHGKEDATRIHERFVRDAPERPEGELIWFHAASVGESQLLLEVARRIIDRGPTSATFLFTCQTQTAAAWVGEALLQDERLGKANTIHQMAPVDTPSNAERFIAHWRPDAAVFAEGEIWPNLLLALARRKTPAALINARMTEKTILGWMRWPKMAARVFGTFQILIAADLQTKTGLEALSQRDVLNPGNLKSALPSPAVDEVEFRAVSQVIGERATLLAASTHPGEEALIIDAVIQMSPRPFLIIAPRHPERGDEVDALLSCTKLAIARRSEDDLVTAQTDVLLADTIGEMGLWYRLADAVYLGGGHTPGIGGHNPLEALRLGKPILTGPSLFNFSDLSKRLVQHEGFTIVEDGEALLGAYPPAQVSKSMLEMLESDALGPISKTMSALTPLLPSIEPQS
ncbi:MAG: glycosyltransferase N-terminal domain-containing protein [Pseudomonadota bacterium]